MKCPQCGYEWDEEDVFRTFDADVFLHRRSTSVDTDIKEIEKEYEKAKKYMGIS